MKKEEIKSDRDNYEDYIKWIDENKMNVLFDPDTGVIGVIPGNSFINVTEHIFPVYTFNKKYIGYIKEGIFIKVTLSDE
jgi:hypothetical protein